MKPLGDEWQSGGAEAAIRTFSGYVAFHLRIAASALLYDPKELSSDASPQIVDSDLADIFIELQTGTEPKMRSLISPTITVQSPNCFSYLPLKKNSYFHLILYTMRIDRIELIHIKMDLVSPFVTSMGTEYDEEHIIVRVDGDGVTGWGESVAEGTPFYSYETVTTAWHILRDFLVPSILGKELSGIGDAIAGYEKVRGHMMAKAGLEAALMGCLCQIKGNLSFNHAWWYQKQSGCGR